MSAPVKNVDHLVIGGGPAGAMTAIKLAEAGRRVTLVEKESAPQHKVCGEFLSREAIEYLQRISIFPSELGAVPIRYVRMSSGAKLAEAELPFQALSISRRVLDAALLARSAETDSAVLRGATVAGLTREGDAWCARLRGGEVIRSRTVFLATGKHDLHGWNRARGAQSDLIGFKLHWRLAPAQTKALRDFIELFLFRGGYGGLSLVEEEAANLCFVVRRATLNHAGGWTRVLAAIREENPYLRQRLQGAEALYPQPLAISPIPYGYMAAQACGLWRVGDQASVIPSFTGDGMSIALHTAALATRMYLEGACTDEYIHIMHAQLRRPMRVATGISRAMVSGPGRSTAPAILTLFPRAMRWIAAATRIPDHAMSVRESALPHSGARAVEQA